jgi:hypothetical protein
LILSIVMRGLQTRSVVFALRTPASIAFARFNRSRWTRAGTGKILLLRSAGTGKILLLRSGYRRQVYAVCASLTALPAADGGGL